MSNANGCALSVLYAGALASEQDEGQGEPNAPPRAMTVVKDLGQTSPRMIAGRLRELGISPATPKPRASQVGVDDRHGLERPALGSLSAVLLNVRGASERLPSSS
jgi:hypothetical protein